MTHHTLDHPTAAAAPSELFQAFLRGVEVCGVWVEGIDRCELGQGLHHRKALSKYKAFYLEGKHKSRQRMKKMRLK
jgi:hypothetical protein